MNNKDHDPLVLTAGAQQIKPAFRIRLYRWMTIFQHLRKHC